MRRCSNARSIHPSPFARTRGNTLAKSYEQKTFIEPRVIREYDLEVYLRQFDRSKTE